MGSCAVLYHYPCPDGAFAALAAHLYFSALRRPVSFYPNTVYNPIKVEDLPIEDFEVIYLLDFVGPHGFVNTLCSKDKSVVILDHHKTAMEMLEANEYDHKNCVKVIDMNRSGATIAYDFFTERLLSENMGFAMVSTQESLQKSSSLVPEKDIQRVGLLYKYVEDADLWRWILPDSKAFSSGLKDMQIEFSYKQNQRLFEQLLALDPRSVIDKGRDSLSHKQKLINEALEQSYEISIGNGKFGNCLATEVETISDLRSELGHQLASKSLELNLRPIGAVVYHVEELANNDILKISLRSIGSEDTTEISQAYGGGGHRNASSFMINRKEFKKWKV